MEKFAENEAIDDASGLSLSLDDSCYCLLSSSFLSFGLEGKG